MSDRSSKEEVSRDVLLAICSKLFDALHELVELNYPVDNDHRKLLREVDDEIGAELGELPDE